MQLLGPPLIEVVLALRQDSHDEVSYYETDFRVIQEHRHKMDIAPSDHSRSSRSTVLSLPRVARRQRSGDEMQLEACLRLLQGYLELIRTQGGTLPLQSIVSSMLSVLECDPDVRKNGGRIGVAVDTSSYYRVPFRYMRRTTQQMLLVMCVLSYLASLRQGMSFRIWWRKSVLFESRRDSDTVGSITLRSESHISFPRHDKGFLPNAYVDSVCCRHASGV